MIARMLQRGSFRMWRDLAIAGLAFQVFHSIEHIGQAVYWLGHTTEEPFLTPWAIVGRDLLAVGGDTSVGEELIHFVGNGFFLIGLVGLCAVAQRHQLHHSRVRWLKSAIAVQAVHVSEHILLSGTYALFGTAMGLSTWFGILQEPALSSTRVWWHFTMNISATLFALAAFRHAFQTHLMWSPSPATS